MSRKSKESKDKEVKPKRKSTAKEMESTIQKQLNGKVYNKHGVKSIDEITGERNNQYRDFKTIEEYETYLSDLDLIDLHEHAVNLSIMPRENRASLVKELLKEYDLRNSDYYKIVEIQPFKFKPLSPELKKYLED